jgi:ribosomal protein L37AE/L43A
MKINSPMLDIYVDKEKADFKDINFDDACKAARLRAITALQIDDSGHCHKFPDFARSESCIQIEFIGMKMTGGMTGWGVMYHFRTWMEKEVEETKEPAECPSCKSTRIKYIPKHQIYLCFNCDDNFGGMHDL